MDNEWKCNIGLFNIEDIYDATDKLKNHKAADVDGIVAEV